jgi:hypothetical protein
MRWTLLFLLTFIAGVHGFALFAPYLFLIAMLAAGRTRRALARLPRVALVVEQSRRSPSILPVAFPSSPER